MTASESYDFSWLDTARNLRLQGKASESLDVIYQTINRLLMAGRFDEVDAMLSTLDVESQGIELLLAIAIMTRPASDELKSREAFFERAWKTFKKNGKDAKKLLGNLRYAPHQMRPRRTLLKRLSNRLAEILFGAWIF